MITPQERVLFQSITEDTYNVLMCDAGNTDTSYVVPLIRRIEAYRREIRLDYGQLPSEVMQAKTGMELIAFKIFLAWKAMLADIPTATFEDAKCIAQMYVPDVSRDVYGYQRVTDGKDDKTPIIKFRMGDHDYVSLVEMEALIIYGMSPLGDMFTESRKLIMLRYLRDIKLSLFYKLIKREDLHPYLEELIYKVDKGE